MKGTSQETIEAEVLEIARKAVGEGIDLSFQVCFSFFKNLFGTDILAGSLKCCFPGGGGHPL